MPFDKPDAWLQERADRDEYSGAVLVQRNSEMVFAGAYGPPSRRWPVPNRMETRFDIASMTKLFTGVAALQLVGAGRLDLDAPITGLVDLAGTTISSAVTVRHLLNHTSGIADDADEEAGEEYEALWVDKPVYSVTETRDGTAMSAENRVDHRQSGLFSRINCPFADDQLGLWLSCWRRTSRSPTGS